VRIIHPRISFLLAIGYWLLAAAEFIEHQETVLSVVPCSGILIDRRPREPGNRDEEGSIHSSLFVNLRPNVGSLGRRFTNDEEWG
jgi:hypothetical protein